MVHKRQIFTATLSINLNIKSVKGLVEQTGMLSCNMNSYTIIKGLTELIFFHQRVIC